MSDVGGKVRLFSRLRDWQDRAARVAKLGRNNY